MSKNFLLASCLFIAFGGGLVQAQYRGMSCDRLYEERNAIYKGAGYCFKTARAIRLFGNAGCQFDNMNDVPLIDSDRAAVAAIVREENRLGCPR